MGHCGNRTAPCNVGTVTMNAHTNNSPNTPTSNEPDEWMLRAKCRGIDPAEFFPSDGTGVDKARRLCEQCVVKAECLEYALENRIEHGVWGGTSERERRRIQRSRRTVVSLTAVANDAAVDRSREPVTTAV